MAQARPQRGSEPRATADPPRGDGDLEVTTRRLRHLGQSSTSDGQPSTVVRLFGSDDFFRLWLAQVVSATGDWIGFLAIVAVATRLGGESPAAAISLVMSARLVPGFFLAPMAGVLVDRWDRRKVMVACDVSRGAVLAIVPFVDTIWGLVVVSLLLEVATLLWSPAKEASVPNLVPTAQLTTANSLSLLAAYGTFPIASLLFAVMASVASWLGGFDALSFLRINQESVAIYGDVVTFLLSAYMISTLAIGSGRKGEASPDVSLSLKRTVSDLREAWHFVLVSPVVRAVLVALGTGLFGGGMLVPLGDVFSRQVLGGGSAGFGFLMTAMGMGAASGVAVLSGFQRRLPKERVFCGAVFLAGGALILGAATSALAPALAAVFVVGLCAGAVYVLGFTILHESVADELRGRIFSSLYTLVRFCLLLAFALGPLLADRLDALSDRLIGRTLELGQRTVFLPGVRLALWLAAAIILAAGFLALLSLRAGRESRTTPPPA